MVSRNKSKKKGSKGKSSKSSKVTAKKNTRIKKTTAKRGKSGAAAARTKKVSRRRERSGSAAGKTIEESQPLVPESTTASSYETMGPSANQEQLSWDTTQTMRDNEDVGSPPATDLSDT